MKVYDYSVLDKNGEVVSLKEYEGKVLLILNSATECGFTPQYDELQDMYEKYGQEGFEILDFPCNQFGNQAPGNNEEIASFCDSKYGITFPIFSKIEVNGESADPLFQHLVSEKGFEGFDAEHPITPMLESIMERTNPNYADLPDIKWNFTKFLVARNGKAVYRFEPTADMSDVEEKVKELL
ncbi:MAG: glutathione peroxidase [Mobilitalea sp.]